MFIEILPNAIGSSYESHLRSFAEATEDIIRSLIKFREMAQLRN